MPYVKIVETPIAAGTISEKAMYSSTTLTNKFMELQASGDLETINEILPNGNAKCTQTWKDEATFNAFNAWLNDSGELAKMQSYHSANNINPIIS